FLDQSASIEVRLPFAATPSSDVATSGAASDKVAFGNINVTLKGLVFTNQSLNVAAGLGIALPTAADARVHGSDGTTLVSTKNDAVMLTPSLAGLWTPNDRLFAQTWLQFGFDTSGNPVTTNLDGTGPQSAGRLRDMTLAQFDAQLGYWLYR